MGIRFSCHGCAKPLNIKTELAGRRGLCPECGTKFRIPLADAEFSTPITPHAPQAGKAVTPNEPSAAAATATPQPATPNPAIKQNGAPRQPAAPSTASSPSTAASPSAEVSPSTADAPQSEPQIEPHPGGQQPATNQPATTDAVNAAATNSTAPSAPSASAEPELLASESTATWYVRPPSGGQYGPATSAMLKVWIDEGRVAKTALLWKDGWPQWREASEALPEIADSLPGSMSLETAEPFPDGPGGSKLTTPIAHEKTSRIYSEFAGDAKIGAVRRKRSSRRITLVAILAALVVGLIVTLFLVASTSG
ncbi:hypothetical protein CKO51_00790 [Rhodopirellula sp. SM50]|nr:DUF4339 domain-containing protein [Rhodopirellula sp. SM50]PAY21405.1 hypothetical protein CKO51_00790 [Rhodopirellula sp. SM50]